MAEEYGTLAVKLPDVERLSPIILAEQKCGDQEPAQYKKYPNAVSGPNGATTPAQPSVRTTPGLRPFQTLREMEKNDTADSKCSKSI